MKYTWSGIVTKCELPSPFRDKYYLVDGNEIIGSKKIYKGLVDKEVTVTVEFNNRKVKP